MRGAAGPGAEAPDLIKGVAMGADCSRGNDACRRGARLCEDASVVLVLGRLLGGKSSGGAPPAARLASVGCASSACCDPDIPGAFGEEGGLAAGLLAAEILDTDMAERFLMMKWRMELPGSCCCFRVIDGRRGANTWFSHLRGLAGLAGAGPSCGHWLSWPFSQMHAAPALVESRVRVQHAVAAVLWMGLRGPDLLDANRHSHGAPATSADGFRSSERVCR